MPNKLYSAVNDYMVEGAKDKGYLGQSNKGFGDGKTSAPVKDYNEGYLNPDSWFEGKSGSKGRGEAS